MFRFFSLGKFVPMGVSLMALVLISQVGQADQIMPDWTRSCPPNGYNNPQPPLDFDLDGDGVNDSWDIPITLPKPGMPGKFYSTTDAKGNSVLLPAIPDPTGPGNGSDHYRPTFRQAGGAKMGVELGQCVYTCGRNTWTLCSTDTNNDCIPDQFTKSTWVSKDGGGNWAFTGKSTTFVTDLTKNKIVTVRTTQNSPITINDAVIVDLGTELSTVDLDGAPIGLPQPQSEIGPQQEYNPPPPYINMLMDPGTYEVGDIVVFQGTLTNAYTTALDFTFDLFGVNFEILTDPNLLSMTVAAGATATYEVLARALALGDAAVVSVAVANGYEDFSMDAVITQAVPEPASLSMLGIAGAVLALGRAARRRRAPRASSNLTGVG